MKQNQYREAEEALMQVTAAVQRQERVDLTEITHVGVDAGDETEENEVAFAEVVEFVRVGVQLLFVELAPARGEEPPPGATSIH